jgi:isoleucyl-tRNA synthetase
VIDPWDILNVQGADPFRWYLYTSGPPGEPRRFSADLVTEVINKFWSTLWNTTSFFVTYANIDNWDPREPQPAVEKRDPLDQWVLAELHTLVKSVTEAFDAYDVPGATRPVQAFVEMLSNWYVRLSRRRFWKGENDDEKRGAYATLYECLVTVAKLIAPTAPFISEALYRNLVADLDAAAPESVHLALWPEYNSALINETAIEQMRVVQRLVSLGRAARESVNIRTRQPLATAYFATREAAEAEAVRQLSDIVKAELNVKTVAVREGTGDVVSYALNPLPNLLGKKFGKNFPVVQKALREGSAADVTGWAKTLLAGANVTLELNGSTYEVTPEEVEVQKKPAEGFAVAEENNYLVALDIKLTDDLVNEGLAREVVRRIQTMRRDADYNIEDKIETVYTASERLAAAMQQFADYIASETLSQSVQPGQVDNGYFRQEFEFDGEQLTVGVKQVG